MGVAAAAALLLRLQVSEAVRVAANVTDRERECVWRGAGLRVRVQLQVVSAVQLAVSQGGSDADPVIVSLDERSRL